MSQEVVYAGMASASFWMVRQALGGSALGAITGAALAAVVAFALNTGFMAGVMALDGARRVVGAWCELAWSAPNYLGFSFAALLVASLYNSFGPLAAGFLVTPLLVLRLAHRGFEQVEEAHRRTLRAFVRAVELKDPYTKGHSERVAEIALAIFRELGSDESELREREYGALLHDVGKIAVSGRILTKPERLTDEEFEVIKAHPALGAAVANDIDFLSGQIPQILFHHERIDGGGYPWGLKGDAIPFEARVLAVADTFDALTWQRPYKLPLSDAGALDEIRSVVGTQLDRVPVAALERLIARGHQFVSRQLRDSAAASYSNRNYAQSVGA